MGKTRLLEEVEARVRMWPLRTVRLSLSADMREVQGAALTAIIRSLGRLSGAAGIGAASAGILISLAPDLQTAFPAVRPARAPHNEAEVVASVQELLQALIEERPLLLLLDDLSDADAWSRRVWQTIALSPPAAWIEVATSRLAEVPRPYLAVPLVPFTMLEVRALLEALAPLPAEAWAEELVQAAHRVTGGKPGLLVRLFRVLAVQGECLPEASAWRVSRPMRLAETIVDLSSQVQLATDAITAHLLQVARVWGRPLEESLMLAIAARRWRDVSASAWREALLRGEREGLLLLQGGEWSGAPGAGVPADDVKGLLDAMRQALVQRGRAALPQLEHLIRLIGAANARPVLGALAEDVARTRAMRALGLEGRALARYLAQVAGHHAWEEPLYRAMGVLGRHSRPTLVALGALAAAALVCCVTLLALWQPRLAVEARPMAMTGVDGAVGLVVQPRIALYDGFGRRRDDLDVTVRVQGERALVMGDTLRQTEHGRAQFERLALEPVPRPTAAGDARPPQLVFRGPWWVRDARVEVSGAWWDGVRDRFRVVRTTVNDRPVGSDHVVTVRAGEDSLRLTITFEFTTDNATANYVVGAGSSWQPHASSVVRVAGLPRPVVDAWQTVRFAVPAPRRGGPYHLVLAMGTEDSVEHLFSATNWAVGDPVWDDGNDLQDLTPRQRAFLRDSGWVLQPGALTGRYRGPQGALAVGDTGWRIGVGEYVSTGELLVIGTAFEVTVSN